MCACMRVVHMWMVHMWMSMWMVHMWMGMGMCSWMPCART